MKFLLEIIDGNDGPACAVVDITPEERDSILARRELWQMVAARDCDLYEMAFTSGAARWYGSVLDDEQDNDDRSEFASAEDSQSYTEDGYGRLRDDFELDPDPELEYRTDVDHVLLGQAGVSWVAYDHYTGQRAETRVLPYSRLLEGS